MKSLLSIILCLISSYNFATIHTVNNMGGSQYNTIGLAINAASNGDTIMIHGSPVTYPRVTVFSKSLVFIGPGFSPFNQSYFPAKVEGFRFGTNIDNIEIQGLYLTHNIVFRGSITEGIFYTTIHNNVKILRNYFQVGGLVINENASTYNNFLIQGNFFTSTNGISNAGGMVTNSIIRNNVFCNSANSIDFFSDPHYIIDHNLFYSQNGYAAKVFENGGAGNSASLIFKNNIFVNIDFDYPSSAVFSNNITYNCVNNTPWLSFTDGGNNIANTNPMLTMMDSVNNGSEYIKNNFRPLPASPVINAGTDGKNIGLLFDENSVLNWAAGLHANIPYITKFVINGTNTVTSGSNVILNANARKAH